LLVATKYQQAKKQEGRAMLLLIKP